MGAPFKKIRTETDHEAALARIEELMDAEPGTAEFDELEVLTVLVERYEEETEPIGLPDPVVAIRFRMSQQGLVQKDLVPYIGSRSKVSEVLNGKIPLSLSMIRRLHTGLGIPAEVLLREPGGRLPGDIGIPWSQFPVVEVVKRGWVTWSQSTNRAVDYAEELLRPLLESNGLLREEQLVFSRQGSYRSVSSDEYALVLWQARVKDLASQESLPDYADGLEDRDFLRELAHLSVLPESPRRAKELLESIGVHCVALRHLPRTRLDGAAMLLDDGSPVVALTLRHDRMDNFWFTLFHELGHLVLHLGPEDPSEAYLDNLDASSEGEKEKEADAFAKDGLIPPEQWGAWFSRHRQSCSTSEVCAFARQIRIHSAIVAGRWRKETKQYGQFSRMLGNGRVRSLLLDVD